MTTEREDFENHMIKIGMATYLHYQLNECQYSNLPVQQLWKTWQARGKKDAERIAELKKKVYEYDKWLSGGVYYTMSEASELHGDYNSKIAALQSQLEASQLQVQVLRESLKNIIVFDSSGDNYGVAKEALSTTPTPSEWVRRSDLEEFDTIQNSRGELLKLYLTKENK